MAALDFPNSPTLNQQYVATNGATYQWDGHVWVVTGGPPVSPVGPVAGDLSGSMPAPTVARIKGAALGTTTPVARGDILVADSTAQFSRLAKGTTGQVLTSTATDAVWQTAPSGAPTGAATGDLSSNYPGPTVSRINGATLGTTTPVTRGDLLVAQGTTPTFTRLAKGTSGQVLIATATDTVWGAAPGGAPSGAAGNVLSGSYPNPGMAAGAAATNVGQLGGDLTGTLPNPSVGAQRINQAKMAIGAATNALTNVPFAPGWNTMQTGAWLSIGNITLTTRGGWILAGVQPGGYIWYVSPYSILYFRLWISQNSALITQVRYDLLAAANNVERFACPPMLGWVNPGAGTWTILWDVFQSTAFFVAAPDSAGYMWAMEFT